MAMQSLRGTCLPLLAVDAGAIMVESQLVRAISPKQCLYTLASKPSHSKQGEAK